MSRNALSIVLTLLFVFSGVFLGMPTAAAPETLPAPTSLQATAVSPVQIDLSWQFSGTGQTGFNVYRKGPKQSSFSQVGTVDGATLKYSDTAVTAGGKFNYKVKAAAGSTLSGYSNKAFAITPKEDTVPAAPSNLTARVVSGSEIDLQWKDNSTNERSFRIERKDGSGTYTAVGQAGPNATAFADTTAALGGQYTYRVFATNAKGDSPPSNEAPAVVPTSLSFQASADKAGPYAADGADGTTLTIKVTDDQGGPMPGLNLYVALIGGDDVKVPGQVQDAGGGTYKSSLLASPLAGQQVAVVSTDAWTQTASVSLTFTPGAPTHFWIANAFDAVVAANLTGTAHFQLMLKDAQENVLDPGGAQYTITTTTPGVSISKVVNSAQAAVDVSVSLTSVATVTNNWSQPTLHIAEALSGTSQDIIVSFPYISLVQLPGSSPGDLAFRLILFDPGVEGRPGLSPVPENYANLMITFPFELQIIQIINLLDCMNQITVAGNVLTWSMACQTPHQGVNALAEVHVAAPPAQVGKFNGEIDGSVVYPTLTEDISKLNFPFYVKPLNNICLKVWLAPGTSKAMAEKQVQVLKDKYDGAVMLCCPNFDFQEQYLDITQAQWTAVDKDGDGKLKEFTQMDPKTTKPKPTAEEVELLKLGDSSCMNVYVVPDMSDGSLGESFSRDGGGVKRDCNNVVLNGSNNTYDTVLAHELGHCMGNLGDNKMPDGTNPPPSNMMWQTKNDANRGNFAVPQCSELWRLNQ